MTVAFLFLLFPAALADIKSREIPHKYWLMIAGLDVLAVFVVPEISLLRRFIGAACISLPMLAIDLIYLEAFGGADIKLMAVCGFFLGPGITCVSAAVAVVLAGIYVCLMFLAGKLKRKDRFPLAPFLCAGMVIGVLWGESIIRWYLSSCQPEATCGIL